MKLLTVIYPFLYLIVPILQLWCVNFAEVKPIYPIKLIIFFMIIYPPIYILINALSHNIINSSIICFGCILIFYNFCAIFKKIQTKKRIGTKLLNIIMLIAITLIPFLPILFNQKIITILSYIFAWAAISVNIIYFLDLAIKILSVIEKNKKIDDYSNIKLTTQTPPDIYYIIPDSYTSNQVLEKYYNFDNSEFTNKLEEMGFNVFYDAKSNYPITICSVNSTLNMDYIEKYYAYEVNLSAELNQLKLAKYHYNNKTANILKKLGYKYYHILNYWEEESVNGSDTADYQISIIPFITSRLIKFVFLGTPIINLIKNLAMKNERNAICKVFNELEKISQEKSSNPKFVMAHIICPHGPFYFDKDGNLPSKKLKSDNYEDYKKLYTGQVEFINKKLEDCFSKIIKNNKNVIIVLQADHGSGLLFINNPDWENLSPDAIKEKYSIQKAVYAPNLNIEAKSSVNTFRYIINSISNADFDILEDKYFYRNYTYSRFKGDSIKVDFLN